MTNKTRPVFEHKSCGRCGGSGQYSYCQTHGTTCFKCHGSGYELTKRGAAAQRKLDAMRKVSILTLSVGDLYYSDNMFCSGWCIVSEILSNEQSAQLRLEKEHGLDVSGNIELRGKRKKDGKECGIIGGVETMVRKGFTAEVKTAQVAECLAYQETLTQAGTVKKR